MEDNFVDFDVDTLLAEDDVAVAFFCRYSAVVVVGVVVVVVGGGAGYSVCVIALM